MFLRTIAQQQLANIALNFFIAFLLLLMVIDAAPFLPDPIRNATSVPVTKALGIWQLRWDLFSPNPDHLNTHLFAKLEYADGSEAEWHAPNWRSQTRVERFWNHRYHRYLENIANPGYALAWHGLTEHIWAEQRATRSDGELPVRTRVMIKDALVPDAYYKPWQSVAESIPLNNQYELYREELP